MLSQDEFSRLWKQYSGRLLIVARAIGEPAEDAVQEAFIKLATQEKLPVEPMAWLVTVTRNQLIQWQRSGQRQQRKNETLAFQREWFVCDDPAESLVAEEVSRVLQELNSEHRQIIVLHLWGEMSFEQIAHVVELSRATTHRRYIEGLELLRKKLDCVFPTEKR